MYSRSTMMVLSMTRRREAHEVSSSGIMLDMGFMQVQEVCHL
jgi:hypothetical protein